MLLSLKIAISLSSSVMQRIVIAVIEYLVT